jgi:uncharacterized protein involved in exopolysaccharide biosynthesis
LNLNGIGQASSSANPAFSSNAVSPTETYKRLLNADRILAAAAKSLDIGQSDLGQPRVELVDQTSLIHFQMIGSSPQDAQARGDAILTAFFRELDALRTDEVNTRQGSSLQAIADYRDSVAGTRAEISTLQDQTGLLSVQQYDVLLDRNLALQTEIRSRAAALSEADAAVAAMSRQLGLDPEAAAKTLKLYADGSYLALIDEVALFGTELAAASAQYGAAHPKVVAAAQLQDLERDFSVAEAVFASAIARAQSSKSDVYASYPLVQVLENPSLADRPSSPNRKLAIAAGIAATLMMLMALAMGWVRLALISRLLTKPAAKA